MKRYPVPPAAVRVLKRDFHLSFGILTACSPPRSSTTLGLACCLSAAEQRLKEIAEAAPAEDLAQIVELNIDPSPSRWRRELRSVLPVRAKLIVPPALL